MFQISSRRISQTKIGRRRTPRPEGYPPRVAAFGRSCLTTDDAGGRLCGGGRPSPRTDRRGASGGSTRAEGLQGRRGSGSYPWVVEAVSGPTVFMSSRLMTGSYPLARIAAMIVLTVSCRSWWMASSRS